MINIEWAVDTTLWARTGPKILNLPYSFTLRGSADVTETAKNTSIKVTFKTFKSCNIFNTHTEEIALVIWVRLLGMEM